MLNPFFANVIYLYTLLQRKWKENAETFNQNIIELHRALWLMDTYQKYNKKCFKKLWPNETTDTFWSRAIASVNSVSSVEWTAYFSTTQEQWITMARVKGKMWIHHEIKLIHIALHMMEWRNFFPSWNVFFINNLFYLFASSAHILNANIFASQIFSGKSTHKHKFKRPMLLLRTWSSNRRTCLKCIKRMQWHFIFSVSLSVISLLLLFAHSENFIFVYSKQMSVECMAMTKE